MEAELRLSGTEGCVCTAASASLRRRMSRLVCSRCAGRTSAALPGKAAPCTVNSVQDLKPALLCWC